jgi:hypothetical protein
MNGMDETDEISEMGGWSGMGRRPCLFDVGVDVCSAGNADAEDRVEAVARCGGRLEEFGVRHKSPCADRASLVPLHDAEPLVRLLAGHTW